jgi:hypothetical protein
MILKALSLIETTFLMTMFLSAVNIRLGQILLNTVNLLDI